MLRPIFKQRRKGVAPLKAARTIVGVTMPDDLHTILANLTYKGGKAYVYGGYLRDWLCLGNNKRSGDIDIAMSMVDFMALKDPVHDVRKHFVLHEPHLPFIIHQMMDGKFEANPRPLVLKLKPEVQEAWGISHPVQLNLYRDDVQLGALLADNDFGINAVAYDGKTIFCHTQFETDFKIGGFTVMRVRDERDYERILRRASRFQADGYGKYPLRVQRKIFDIYHARACYKLDDEGFNIPWTQSIKDSNLR